MDLILFKSHDFVSQSAVKQVKVQKKYLLERKSQTNPHYAEMELVRLAFPFAFQINTSFSTTEIQQIPE